LPDAAKADPGKALASTAAPDKCKKRRRSKRFEIRSAQQAQPCDA
jgi:hypothetical protein